MNQGEKSVTIGRRTITKDSRPYVIAEIGVNHEGSIERAKRLIKLAKKGGADAAKFQSYKAEKLASRHSPSYWDTSKESTTSQYTLFKKYDMFEASQYIELADFCDSLGIDFLSTPFDEDAVEFLDPLVSSFKVASADITNVPLLRRCASKKKPIILSTGASSLVEIDFALKTLEDAGCKDIILLHCILNYPTSDSDANLSMIEMLKKDYPNSLVGYSDHTLPDNSMLPLISAYLKGAVVLEKHFTDDKNAKGNDHYHSMDVYDLERLTENLTKVRLLLGNMIEKRPLQGEEVARRNARRSVVLKNNIKAGSILREEDLTCKRPAHGICASNWDSVIGMIANRDILEDEILQWDDISPAKTLR